MEHKEVHIVKRDDVSKHRFRINSIGNKYEICGSEYQVCKYEGYGWLTSSPKPNSAENNYTKHPKQNLNILSSFDKIVEEHISGIYINLRILGYYTCGPCGHYAEVFGRIDDQAVHA